MSKQFGTFEGLDNRKAVMDMFRRIGHGDPEEVAAAKRACFLESLMRASTMPGMAGKPCRITPCSPADAYIEFVAITGCLGVDIDLAAKKLEEVVRA
jgi:hypothetical protein